LIILYVVSTLKRCGPTNQLFGLIKNLDRSRFTPVVLTLSPEPSESRWDDFLALGIDVQSLSLGRVAGLLMGRRALRTCLAAIKPTLIHSQGIRADSLCVQVVPPSVAHVATLRNYPFKDYVMSFGRVQGELMAHWHLFHLRRVHAAALVSNAIHGMLNGRLKQARVIQNGVDVDRYHKVDSIERDALRDRLGLPPQARIFVSTGHLDPRKDPVTAIDGFLAGSRDSDQFLVLGDGAMREELNNRYNQSRQVRFLGRVANVQEYLQASDYFISASLAEGLPNAVLEALACGLPCFLSDIAEHREILAGSSLQHMLFSTGQTTALAECIKGLNDDAYEQESVAAVAIVAGGFSAAHMSAQYQSLYTELRS
jgi:glycosyltransferase involved in cell wall biosynthesis